MIYITFERGGPNFSNTAARALAQRTAVQQRQLRAKWLRCSTRFLAFVSSLKLSRRLLYSVHFVFISTFNLQRGRTFVVGITNLSKQAVCVKAKACILQKYTPSQPRRAQSSENASAYVSNNTSTFVKLASLQYFSLIFPFTTVSCFEIDIFLVNFKTFPCVLNIT